MHFTNRSSYQCSMKIILERFKDDINTISNLLPLGARQCPKNQELQYSNLIYIEIYQTNEEKKIFELEDSEKNTMFVLHQIANNVDSTKNSNVILPSSALTWNVKRTVFTQEAHRRIRNTSQRLGPHAADEVLSKFMLHFKMAGHNHQLRAEILKSAKHAFTYN